MWSVQTSLSSPRVVIPGPTYPAQVESISSWMSPWFHAKLWLVRAGIDAQVAGVAHAAPPEAKKNQSGSANGVNVGVLAGSAVTVRQRFIAVLSACATMMLFWTNPVYGFS